jgi:methylase of polypeptide subunit release factors
LPRAARSVTAVDVSRRALACTWLNGARVARRRGPLKPLLSTRSHALRARGHSGPEHEEELHVVRGRRR